MTNYPFAARVERAQGSSIRELLKVAGRKDIISFAGGLPSPDLFDLEGVRAATTETLERDPEGALQYAPTEGYAPLRRRLANLTRTRGADVGPDDLIVTSGSQQGIDLIARVMVDPGDTVVVERPSYLAAIQVFNLAQANIVGVDVDEEGMDVEALERVIVERRPKLVYTIATFANPSGATLSLQRRRRVLELAAEHGVLVVEDDPYAELRFRGDPLPSLLALSATVPGSRPWCVYLSSLSKIVAPGLRIAWMVLPEEVRPKVVVAKQGADLQSSTFTQHVALRYLESGRLEPRLPDMRTAYGERCDAMVDALARHLPAGMVSYTRPDGGMFLWARLAEGVDAGKIVDRAVPAGVIFVPGASFFPDRAGANFMRLSFATPTPEQIDEGMRRLAGVMLD